MLQKHRFAISICIGLLVIVSLISQFVFGFNKCLNAIEPRTIVDTNQFALRWSIDDLFVEPFYGSSNSLFSNAENSYAVGALGDCESFLLKITDSDVTPIFSMQGSGRLGITSFVTDDTTLYATYSSSLRSSDNTKLNTLGSGGIAAYDLKSGQQLWNTQIPGAQIVGEIFVENGVISVDGGSTTSNNYLLNAESGKILLDIPKKNVLSDQSDVASVVFALWSEFRSTA